MRVTPTLSLYVGLANGVLMRAAVDGLSGELGDAHSHFVGTRAVTLCPVPVRDASNSDETGASAEGLAALSSRAWLCYAARGGRTATAPLSGPALTGVAGFASAQCAAGYVGVHGRTLRVFTLARLDAALSQTRHALPRTPRRLAHCAAPDTLAVLERDERGASGLRVLDAASTTTLCAVDYAPAEAALALATGPLRERGSGSGGGAASKEVECVVVGTALAGGTRGRIYVYAHTPGRTLELLHATDVAPDSLSGPRAAPRALHVFAGRLLAGVGASVRIYELGRRQLLRKGEFRTPSAGPPLGASGASASGPGGDGRSTSSTTGASTPATVPPPPADTALVCAIHSVGTRVAVGDARESYTLYQYTAGDGAFVPLADDSAPRWVATGAMLDHDTVACGDKFGSLALLRVPAELAAALRVRPAEAVRQLRLCAREEAARPRAEARFAAGVLDERGTFLVLSEAELKAIADDINAAGRVSLADIVRIANTHISIPPPPEDDAVGAEAVGDGADAEPVLVS